jgi:mannose-1-phosphate guanylyltransferase
MKAMILCAGLGTRLRPFTERWPKPALPLLGQPLFRYHLAVLRAAGVTAVGINTHHLPRVMEETARAECERVGLPLHVVHEPVIQGTGGGIRGLRDFLSDGDFLVFNGDILFPVDLRPVVTAHREFGAVATMVLLPMPEHETYASVDLDAGGQVRRIAGRGPGGEGLVPWHFTGVHVLSPRVFDFMRPEGPEDINRDVYVRMMEAGLRVQGAPVRAYWSDLGTPARYLGTVRDVLGGQVPLTHLGADSPFAAAPRGAGPFWAHASAVVEGEVTGPAWFGARSRLPRDARVGASVAVGEDVKVGPGAQLERCALLEGTEVAPSESLVDVLAWGAYRVHAPR